MQKDWRKMLTELGGWDNDLLSVPAGAVREIIEEVEALRESASVHATIIATKDGEIAALTAEVTHLAEKLAGSVDRNSVLEEAALACAKGVTLDEYGDAATESCAYAIRALKSAAPQPVDAAQAVPEGLALVPLIPTDEICDAPDVTIGGCYSCSAQLPTWGEHEEIYQKMIAAAPVAQPTDTTKGA